jgi:hypothetical protein
MYALGGGLGHLQRSLSLCRTAARRGHQSVILSNSPVWPRIAANLPLPGTTVRHLVGDDATVLAEANHCLQTTPFDVLVVDTLPRGICGELANRLPNVPTVFVHRDLAASYAAQPDVMAAVRQFDLMLCPGERGQLEHRNAVTTGPWVLLHAEELLEPVAVRTYMGCPPDRPLVVVCDAADPEEAAGLATIADLLRSRFGSAVHVHQAELAETWPLMRLHLGVDLLVGAGGYNTVHEARLTATPFRAVARQRLYDRQHRRLRSREWLEVQDQNVPPRRPAATVRYTNGTEAAVDAIERLVG